MAFSMKRRIGVVLLLSLLAACASKDVSTEQQNEAQASEQYADDAVNTELISTPQERELRIGISNFAEQDLIYELTKAWLAKNTKTQHIRLKAVNFENFTGAVNAMRDDKIDLYWGYTASFLSAYNIKTSPPYDAKLVYERVKAVLAENESQFSLLDYSPLHNDYAFVVRRDIQDFVAVRDLSEVASSNRKWVFGIEPDYLEYRDHDGWEALAKFYGFNLANIEIKQIYEREDLYRALRLGMVDVGLVYKTDQELDLGYLRLLEDDKLFFSPYNMVPVLRTDLLEAEPALVSSLNAISGSLSNELMRYLLQRYEIDGVELEVISEEFLLCVDDRHHSEDEGSSLAHQGGTSICHES